MSWLIINEMTNSDLRNVQSISQCLRVTIQQPAIRLQNKFPTCHGYCSATHTVNNHPGQMVNSVGVLHEWRDKQQRGYEIACRLSVCPSLCLSVRDVYFESNFTAK